MSTAKREAAKREAFKALALYVTSPARDENGPAWLSMFLEALIDLPGGCGERFEGWSDDAIRNLMECWIDNAPDRELPALRNSIKRQIAWLDYFENDRAGEIRGGPLRGARKLVPASQRVGRVAA